MTPIGLHNKLYWPEIPQFKVGNAYNSLYTNYSVDSHILTLTERDRKRIVHQKTIIT